MKSLGVTIAVNLVLSLSSTVVGMPYAHDLGFHGSISTRSSSKHSLLGDRLTETGPKGLFKRENNMIKAQKIHCDGHNHHDNYNDEDEVDECEDSSDSSYAEHRSTPNFHAPYKIGLNSTIAHSPKSKSPLPNSSASATQYSSKPSKGLSQPRSYAPSKEKHNDASQKYDASSVRYASASGDVSKRHGFMGYYNGYHGKATFFSQGGSAGACGKVHQDSDYVVAIQSQMYDGGKFCGKTVIVTRKSTGKSIKCLAADECPGCPTDQSLDLSIGAFNALGTPDEGIFDIHWRVMD